MRKYVLFFLFLMYMSAAHGQQVVGVVDYLKVEEVPAFLELQKKWLNIHEAEMKQEAIVGWALFQVMYKTADAQYNFVSIRWYSSFSQVNEKIKDQAIKAAYPSMTKEERKAMKRQTSNLAQRMSQKVFYRRLTCSADKLDKQGMVYLIHEIHVKPSDSKEYVELCEKFYKPLYQEDIHQGNRTAWSLWEKWPGNTKDYQYIAADGYVSTDQIDHSNFMDYFKKIHPDANPDIVSKNMEKLRVLTNNEMWKMIYRIN